MGLPGQRIISAQIEPSISEAASLVRRQLIKLTPIYDVILRIE